MKSDDDVLKPANDISDLWRTWLGNAAKALNAHESVAHTSPASLPDANPLERLRAQVPDELRQVVIDALFQDRNEANSVSMAESLLCILLPADMMPEEFSLVAHGQHCTKLFNRLADSSEDGRLDSRALYRFMQICAVYVLENTSQDGRPLFRAGSYIDELPSSSDLVLDQLRDRTDIVDSYVMAISVCLPLLSMLKRWMAEGKARFLPSEAGREFARDLREVVGQRLTAALLGTCAAFTVVEMDATEWQERTRVVWKPEKMSAVRNELKTALGDSILEGSEDEAFELGWTWSQMQEPAAVPGSLPIDSYLDRDQPVWPEPAPYIYFTLQTLDGLQDLFAPRVQAEELLDAEQLVLASRLRSLSTLTTRYWRVVATDLERFLFSDKRNRAVSRPGRMAVESLPWRTSDGDSSDLWSLYLIGILLNELATNRDSLRTDEVTRLWRLLQELAERARVVREPIMLSFGKALDAELGLRERFDQAALWTQIDGKRLILRSDERDAAGECNPLFGWSVYDFVPQLLKRTAQLARYVSDWDERLALESLVSDIWSMNLATRSIKKGVGSNIFRTIQAVDNAYGEYKVSSHNLWDDPGGLPYAEDGLFEAVGWMARTEEERGDEGGAVEEGAVGDDTRAAVGYRPIGHSWYMTERVVEALVAVDAMTDRQGSDAQAVTAFVESLRESALGSLDTSERAGVERELRAVQEHARRGDAALALSQIMYVLDRIRSKREATQQGRSMTG